MQGYNRPSLVHINSNCKLDLNFNVGTGSNGVAINDLALVGDRLYIGGNFTDWNGVPKGYLTAVNRITGELDPGWLASVDSPVNAFAKDTDGLFIAGQFINLNGAGFGRLAKVNYTSGATITSFNTGISAGAVRGITLGVDASNNKVIYAVGSFTAGTNYFARSFTMSGNLTTWNPNPNALVDLVVYNQNKVYLAGSFTQINGATNRNYFAIVDNNTGTVGPEDLSLANGSTVASLTLHEGKLYVLGNFSTVFGRDRMNAFSVDPLTGNISDWNPRFPAPFTYPNGKISLLNGQYSSSGSWCFFQCQCRQSQWIRFYRFGDGKTYRLDSHGERQYHHIPPKRGHFVRWRKLYYGFCPGKGISGAERAKLGGQGCPAVTAGMPALPNPCSGWAG